MAIILADIPLDEVGLYGVGFSDTARMVDGIWTAFRNYSGFSNNPVLTTGGNGESGSGISLRTFGYTTLSDQETTVIKTWAGNATAGLACKLWADHLPYKSDDAVGAGEAVFQFGDTSNVERVCVRLGCDGSLYAMTPDPSGTIIGRSDPCIRARSQHHIEIKVTIGAGSTDTLTIRVDGVEALALTSQNFGDVNIGRIEIGSAYDRGTSGEIVSSMYFSSIIIWDGSGSTNNDWLGPNVCYHTLYPDGDAALNWTPSTGATGFDLIDDDEPGDADYVYATSTAASATDFTFENSSNLATVNAVLAVGRASKTDAGGGSIQISLSPNGTNWDAGQTKALAENNFNYWYDVSEASPATAVAWTAAEINSLEMRVDRTA